MARFDNVSCEPFRAWNRLEPRARTTEFDRVLQVGVHDALWALTRQWQFGEFAGEDTGSAIFAKVQLQFTQLSHYRALNGAPQPYTDAEAFEQTIERLPAPLDDKVRLQAGSLFRQLLAQQAGSTPFDQPGYLARLRQLFPLPTVPAITPDADPDAVVAQAKAHTNTERAQFLAFFGYSAFDGVALYQQAKADATAVSASIGPDAFVAPAVSQFLTEMELRYPDELRPPATAWNARQLEYQFKCLLPDDNAAQRTVLTADEYYTGRLDWYSFDVDLSATGQDAFAAVQPTATLLTHKTVTVIPTEARFAGMPNSRWWEFEEGEVDLGNIRSDTTDLAKLVFSEYALVYGNNYLMLPVSVPVGTLSEVKGILVTDVFGERRFIKPAIQGDTDNWTSWGMFNLTSRRADGDRHIPADTRLWVPPATVKTHESVPIEEVYLLRDEIANLVWALETKVANQVGRALDGHTFAVALRTLLEQLDPTPPALPAPAVALHYTLANTVPENWIPFIPVNLPGQNRAIQLQRASMPRVFRAQYHPVRPLTAVLQPGLEQHPVAPYFINEEEVPRAGAQLTSTYQQTRWYGGKTLAWYGYRKTLGRGEGSSGLQFDRVEAVPAK